MPVLNGDDCSSVTAPARRCVPEGTVSQQRGFLCSAAKIAEGIALLCRYYARPEAWVVPPSMQDALHRIRQAGVKVCVVSNFDDRLRPLLAAMDLDHLFDEIIVSSEVGAEKPNPKIFDAACSAMGVDPSSDFVLHVGDDRRNDVWGARACGIDAWLWGEDVRCFDEIADRIVTGYTTL